MIGLTYIIFPIGFLIIIWFLLKVRKETSEVNWKKKKRKND